MTATWRSRDELVHQIVTLAAGKMSKPAIARTVGVSRNTVKAVLAAHAAQRVVEHSAMPSRRRRHHGPRRPTRSGIGSPSCSSVTRTLPASACSRFSAPRGSRRPDDRRAVFQAMFREGLSFEPPRTPDDARQIWKISGDADFAAVTERSLVSFSSRPQRDSNPCYLRERRVS